MERLPIGVLGAVVLEQLNSVRREVQAGMRRVDEEAHAGDCRCEAMEAEAGRGEPIGTVVLRRDSGRVGTHGPPLLTKSPDGTLAICLGLLQYFQHGQEGG